MADEKFSLSILITLPDFLYLSHSISDDIYIVISWVNFYLFLFLLP